jgi:hypothetical protein
MLAHTQGNVDACLMAADESFKVIASAATVGDVERRLRGKPAVSGFKRLN